MWLRLRIRKRQITTGVVAYPVPDGSRQRCWRRRWKGTLGTLLALLSFQDEISNACEDNPNRHQNDDVVNGAAGDSQINHLLAIPHVGSSFFVAAVHAFA